MANKYGYMAKIGIDTTGVQNGLNEADSAMRAFSREMREVNNVIRQGGDSAEMAAQRNQLYSFRSICIGRIKTRNHSFNYGQNACNCTAYTREVDVKASV